MTATAIDAKGESVGVVDPRRPILPQAPAVEGAPVLQGDPVGIARLVDDVVAQRPGADRELVDRFKHHVARLLTRMLGPGPDVDDLLQEVMFRVFRRLHKVDPPGALPGYVTAITVLVAREAIKKRRRSRWLSFFSDDVLAEITATHGANDVPDDVRTFYEALAKLSDHDQVCITLRHVEGMGLEEVAEAVGVSLATIKRHLQRAEAQLLEVLGHDGRGAAPWTRGGKS